MGVEKSNRFLKIFIGILAVCLLGLGVYTVQFYNETQSNLNILEREKARLETELNKLKHKYDEALTANKNLQAEFAQAKKQIENLIDSIENTEFDYVSLQNYREQIKALKQENRKLFVVIDSLETKNKSLQQEIDIAKTELAKTEHFSDSLILKNKTLAEKVFKASQLKIVGTSEGGVIIHGGKAIPTSKSGRTEKIQVCFLLGKNELAVPEVKKFHIQVINPRDALLGKRENINYGEAVLSYSKIVSVDYENEEIETCTLVDAKKENLVPGRYIVNIFLGPELLSSKIFMME